MGESFKRFNTVFSSGWIDIGTSWSVNEVMSRAQKLQMKRSLVTGDGLGGGVVFQALLKDSFNAVNIDQLEPQRSLTSSIEPCCPKAFGQAQQFLGRTEPAPRELTG